MVSDVFFVILLTLYIFHANAEPSVNNEGSSCYKVNAPECSGGGNYNCGVCECFEQYEGHHCECLRSSGSSSDPEDCITPESGLECSGRGACICGQCECELRINPNEASNYLIKNCVISGKWCECDNFSCDRFMGEICGSHGKCECGQCFCDLQWIGNACECYNATDNCYPSSSSQICSGRGECVCNQCQCFQIENSEYIGRFCEDIKYSCDVVRPCALCTIQKDDNTCLEICGNTTVIQRENLEDDVEEGEYLCKGSDQDGCEYAFLYKEIQDKTFVITISKELTC
ncbi:hypothetical protein ILUMI_03216 [Ignelater luminosus]|uniref:Integrin beta subunit tail domain-containing protein n=1 Tax=Ignelater luminosus TaxID=2038154 RepID=A0A8K0GME0_IGNLU|nr:hypothetical protein ILUMI_03216 [Ignelater luminosus]